MKLRSVVAASVVALATIACGPQDSAPDTDGTWIGTITTEGNVTTVVNESGSVWGGTARLVEEASIGVDIGGDPYMLAWVTAITATGDRIFLLDENPSRVRVYDMTGAHLRDIGTEGQGPGEFNRVFSIAIRPDGKLLVRADGNGRMNVFSLDGEFLEDWPLPGGYATSSPMVMMTDGTVYTRLPVGEMDEMGIRRGVMVPFGIDGSQAGPPIFLPDGEPLLTLDVSGTSRSGRPITRTLGVPFSPRPASALSPLGALVLGVGDEYRFEFRRFDGTTLAVKRSTQPFVVLPEEAAWHRRYTTALARDLDSSWSWNGPGIPESKPFFSAFFADQGGRVWVRRPGPGRHSEGCDENPNPGPISTIARCWENTEIVEVFAPDGRYLGVVDLPDGAQFRAGRAFASDDLVLLRMEDEAGTIMVKRYRLALPGEERQ